MTASPVTTGLRTGLTALLTLAMATALHAAGAPRPAQAPPAGHPSGPWHPPLVLPTVLPRVAPAERGDRLIVLMFHHVGPLPPNPEWELRNLTVSAERFEADLRALKAAGCRVMTMGQGNTLLRRRQLPKRAVVLTFDDGYADNYTVAWPLLRKYGYVGTFNLVYDKLGSTGHMTKPQAKEMAAAGNEIGSHTMSHTPLPYLDAPHLHKELIVSKQKLETVTGLPVVTFCYPEGRYGPRDLRAVQAAGYQLAMTVESGRWRAGTPPLEIPRLRMAERTDLSNCLNAWLGSGPLAPRYRRM